MARQVSENPLLVLKSKAADMCGLCPNVFQRLLDEGDIKTIRVGRRVLIPIKELERWIDRQLDQAVNS